eukprot:scaffold79525_cov111-Cyclotella_meneghiniana.AAC.2
MATARQTQRAISKEALQQIKAGGVGHVPEDKGDETARFIFENFNSLAPWKNLHKYHRLNQLIRHFDADFALGVELQVQWHECDRSLRLEKHLAPSRPKRIAYGFNEHENFGRCQYGGTCAASLGRLAQLALAQYLPESSAHTSRATPKPLSGAKSNVGAQSTTNTVATSAALGTTDARQPYLLTTWHFNSSNGRPRERMSSSS